MTKNSKLNDNALVCERGLRQNLDKTTLNYVAIEKVIIHFVQQVHR